MLETLFATLKTTKNSPALKKDEVAKILRISPEALEAFEKAYEKYAFEESDNFFEMNAKQAVMENEKAAECSENLEELKGRIVKELLSQTVVYSYDGKNAVTRQVLSLPDNTVFVNNNDIKVFSEDIRPQLAGNLMKVDISEPTYMSLLFVYDKFQREKNPKLKKEWYHRFRQGLDILDLDTVIYEIIGMNKNSMGYWLPKLVEACKDQSFFRIPATTIAKVPLSLLQLTRQDYFSLTRTTLDPGIV